MIADQTDVGAGAANVQGDDVGAPGGAGHVDGADDTGGGTGKGGPNGIAAGLVEGHQAAARLIDADGSGDQVLADGLSKKIQVLGNHRLQIGVENRGRQPFVLPKFRLNLGRKGNEEVGPGFAQGRADRPFVSRIQEGKQETDGAGLDIAFRDLLHRLLDVGLVHVPQNPTGGENPFRHFKAQFPGRQGRGAVDLHVEHVGAGLAPDLQEIAETPRGDQGDPSAAPLDEGVGADRCSVAQPDHVGGGDGVLGAHFLQAVGDGSCRIVGCRSHLVYDVIPGGGVGAIEIGEGSPDIHSNNPRHG